MIFNDEAKKKYSSGSLLKKCSCNGRTIKIEPLDVKTAERINRRVEVSMKQNRAEHMKSKMLAEDEYSD